MYQFVKNKMVLIHEQIIKRLRFFNVKSLPLEIRENIFLNVRSGKIN